MSDDVQLDPQTFRRVMSRFAAGVTIITSVDEDGEWLGFTATAFSSLSLDPPLVLVCVTKGTRAHKVLEESPAFGVSILAVQQEELALRFANPRIADRFAGVPTRVGHGGVPFPLGTLAAVECDRFSLLDGGDHVVVVGRVREAVEADRPPLLHYQGAFNRVADPDPAPSATERQMGHWLVGLPW